MQRVKFFTIVLSILTLVSSFPSRALQVDTIQNLSEMKDFLHQRMTYYMEEENIANAAIALVTADEISFLQGYGYADPAQGVEVDASRHLFSTGSVSKLFTWAAVMQLYEQGRLDLDTDINEYLDFTPENTICYKDTIERPITLRHLMSHTAGYEDVLEGLFSFKQQPSLREYLLKYNPARIFPPGTVMAYSNYGTTLAGYIVEQVSGMPFEDYIRNHIFLPLGMTSSTFHQPVPNELQGNMVNAGRWVDGTFIPGHFEHMPAPAGGLSLSASDMALFMQANLNRGENAHGRFLRQETIHMMHSPLRRYHPLIGGMAYGFMLSNYNGQTVVHHAGSSSLFDAGLYLLPELGLGIFIVYSGGNYATHSKIFREFTDRFFTQESQLNAEELKPVVVVNEPLDGEYHQSRSLRTRSDRMLNLLIGSMRVKTEADNKISFTLYQDDFSLTAIAPGIYKNDTINTGYPFGPLQYLLTSVSPDRRIMLLTDGPMTFIKAKWYETSTFAIAIFLIAMILAITSILLFITRWLIFLLRSKKNFFSQNRQGFLYFLHGLLFLIFVIIMAINSAPHPAHLLPTSFFEPNPFLNILLSILPYIIVLTGSVIIAYFIREIKKSSVGIIGIVFFSIYSLSAIALTWLFWFYNFL